MENCEEDKLITSPTEFLGLKYDNPLEMLKELDWLTENGYHTLGYVGDEDINMFSVYFDELAALKIRHARYNRSEDKFPLRHVSEFYITHDEGQTIDRKLGTKSVKYIFNPFYEPIGAGCLLEYRGGSILRNGNALASLETIENFINEYRDSDQMSFRGLEFMFPSLVTTLIRRGWLHTTEWVYQKWMEKCRIY